MKEKLEIVMDKMIDIEYGFVDNNNNLIGATLILTKKLFFGHKMRHLQCSHLPAVCKIQYTGLNYPQVQEFCGDKILAPYICMGFSMLSLLVPDGFMTVNEGDTICKDGLGNFWVE